MKATIALLTLVLTSAATASVFELDREHLFRTCSKMNAYDVEKPYGPVVRRGSWTFGTKQQEGAKIILDAWKLYGDGEPNHLAYALATARRESGGTFFPIREAPGCGTDDGCRERAIGRLLRQRADRRNAQRQQKGLAPLPVRANYAVADKNGRRYYGRGFNQLTGPASYSRAGELIKLDLLADPDKVLNPQISARILIEGLLKGWFGSRKPVSYYLDRKQPQWDEARATTNPGSPNSAITGSYARDFRQCIRLAA